MRSILRNPCSILWGAVVCVVLVGGCGRLRFAPGQSQKQNAWLHHRTAAMTARMAQSEGASEELQSLAELNVLQSEALTSYFGLPEELPPADSVKQVLGKSNWQLAQTALSESADRPNPWDVADSVLELGIGVCALVGGVYGTRAVGFLKQTRARSNALKEVIAGNELFKKNNAEAVVAFKQAHQNQSPQTRQIVTTIKG